MTEVIEAIQKVEKAFEEYKKENDSALSKIKDYGYEPSELKERVEKADKALQEAVDLKERLDKLELKSNRPGVGDAEVSKAEHKEAYLNWVRKGKGEDKLKELQHKAMNITTATDGGNAVPEVVEAGIASRLLEISPIRSIAKVISVSTSDYKKLVNVGGMASGWVDEDDARPETNTPSIQQIVAVMGEIYANPAATQTMLDDASFNVESFMAEDVAKEIALKESQAFVVGDGLKKPKGFLDYTTAATADGARAFQQIEHVATGVANDWPVSNPSDIIFDLIDKLKSGYRQGAKFVGARSTLTAIRKFKDSTGQYLWQPALAAGNPQTIAGYGYVEAEDMPAVGADALALAFGDFNAGYCIVDRVGIRQLRDPYTNKPYVQFYTTKRVGGMVIEDEAIKLLKFAVS